MKTLSLRLALGLVACLATSLFSAAAAPGIIAQQAYVKASNTGNADQFGTTIALSGNTLVVGAPLEDSRVPINGDQTDNSASDAGAVYVYVRYGTQWVQQAFLKASNAASSDQFGYSVAISGDTIVVGAPYEDSGITGNQADESATDAGAVYVFVRTGTTWTQQAYLKAAFPDMDDNFGISVAISGNTILAGAWAEASNATGINGNQADDSASFAGAAYVFTRTGTAWTQQAYLKASNAQGSDYFGISVALSGDTAVVGANFEESNATGVNGNQANNSAPVAGAAYVFQRSGSTWAQQAYLKASNTEAGDNFGFSVAISGDTIVVGALEEDSNGVGGQGNNGSLGSGAAYVFARTGNQWSQQAYLKASNPGDQDSFGCFAGISGNTIVVGARQEDSNAKGVNGIQSDNSDSNAGAAYVFTRTGTNWNQQAYLKASNGADYFGWSCATSGDLVAVGSIYESSDATGINGNGANVNASQSGSAYVFGGLGPVFDSLARTGTSVDGVQDVAFGVPGIAAVSNTGTSIFASGLTGSGAPRGREQGMFAGGSTVDLLLQKRDVLASFGNGYGPGSSVAALINPCTNQAGYGGLFQILAAGSGITRNNNQALIRDNGAFLKLLGRTGQPISVAWGSARPNAFPEVVESFDTDLIAVATRLLVSSPDGVSAIDDSGLLVLDHNGTVLPAPPLREDEEALTGSGKLGQMSGRVATTTGDAIHFTGFLKPTGGGAALNALFGTNMAGGITSQIKQTDAANGATPASTYSSFPAIGQRGNDPFFRAMLAGPPKTQNEGLWISTSFILQKGAAFTPKGVDPTGADPLTLLDFPGIQVTRILRFWPVAPDQVIVQAVLGGTGVTKSNNTAVLLRQSDGEWVILLRGGQVAPGGGSPSVKVGAIQSVEVDPIQGNYAIVASLVGASATSNQALWGGVATAGTPSSRQRSLPTLRLRKGDPYSSDRTARDLIRSISLKIATEPTGGSGRGLGQAVNANGDIAVTLTGDRRIQELVLLAN